MTHLANERVAYFNGAILPESEARVSLRDRGFIYGDAAFDTARTFAHRIFKLEEHIERFYRSLRYLRIEPGIGADEMARISEQVVERNRHLLGPDDDYWITQRVTRGIEAPEGDAPLEAGPTVIVECEPLPLQSRAPLFRDGIEVVTPSVRRTPPEALSPRAKTHNYLNLIMADLEAKARAPGAWAVLLDGAGKLTEGLGSNFVILHEGTLLTPEPRFVLGGISRETVIALARKIGLPVEETAIDLHDVANASEAFLTATSLCLCPVRSVNGQPLREGRVPGPVTEKLTEAYIDLVGFDFVAQYLRRLDP